MKERIWLNKVVKLGSDISTEITTTDISTVHRLGWFKLGATRSVICRLVRHKRDMMNQNRKKLKDMPEYRSKVYITGMPLGLLKKVGKSFERVLARPSPPAGGLGGTPL